MIHLTDFSSIHKITIYRHTWYYLRTGTQKEEAPPIIPYQGDIYAEVEKTGLFASQHELPTTIEPEYSTISIDTTPQVCTGQLFINMYMHVRN